jgi:hypothetical protein
MNGGILARALQPRLAVVAEVAAWLAAGVLCPLGHNDGWLVVLGRNDVLEWLARPHDVTQAELTVAIAVLGLNRIQTSN